MAHLTSFIHLLKPTPVPISFTARGSSPPLKILYFPPSKTCKYQDEWIQTTPRRTKSHNTHLLRPSKLQITLFFLHILPRTSYPTSPISPALPLPLLVAVRLCRVCRSTKVLYQWLPQAFPPSLLVSTAPNSAPKDPKPPRLSPSYSIIPEQDPIPSNPSSSLLGIRNPRIPRIIPSPS